VVAHVIVLKNVLRIDAAVVKPEREPSFLRETNRIPDEGGMGIRCTEKQQEKQAKTNRASHLLSSHQYTITGPDGGFAEVYTMPPFSVNPTFRHNRRHCDWGHLKHSGHSARS
jgi:hypothetical protein